MVKQEIRKYAIVAHLITIYFYDKPRVMAKVEADQPWQD
jgi:hypothetical protein